jgi:hypothetical protein
MELTRFARALPNEPIKLYEGIIGLAPNYSLLDQYDSPKDAQAAVEQLANGGPGCVSLEWLPVPRVEVRVEVPPRILDVPSPVRIELKEAKAEARATIWREEERFNSENRFMANLTGLIDNIQIGDSKALTALLFHAVNFRAGRPKDGPDPENGWALSVAEWMISMRDIWHPPESILEMEQRGGHEITLLGRIERSDGRTFSVKDAAPVLASLRVCFSFCRAAFTDLFLLMGLDSNGGINWELWRAPLSDPERPLTHPAGEIRSWFNFLDPDVSELLRGFLSLGSRLPTIARAIEWYVQANSSRPSSGLVHAQTGLEIISWHIFVEHNIRTANEFNQIRATGRITSLLEWASIDPGIPAGLPHLSALANEKEWPSGPRAITELRNGIIHPVDGNDPGPRELVEAWQLSLHYLELSLLKCLQYHGQYLNRLGQNVGVAAAFFDVDKVPWSSR